MVIASLPFPLWIFFFFFAHSLVVFFPFPHPSRHLFGYLVNRRSDTVRALLCPSYASWWPAAHCLLGPRWFSFFPQLCLRAPELFVSPPSAFPLVRLFPIFSDNGLESAPFFPMQLSRLFRAPVLISCPVPPFAGVLCLVCPFPRSNRSADHQALFPGPQEDPSLSQRESTGRYAPFHLR